MLAGVKNTICNIASISSENHNNNSCPGLIGRTHCSNNEGSEIELDEVDCLGEDKSLSCTL